MLKVVSNRLQTTRNKVSRRWAKYRKVKKKVLHRKNISLSEKQQILLSERGTAKTDIKQRYEQYQEFKFPYVRKSGFQGFTYQKNIIGTASDQKIYKARKGFNTQNLNKIVPKILSQRRVKGILIVFEVTDENDYKSYVSNYITEKLYYERILANKESVYDYVLEKVGFGYKEERTLRFIYLRIIYEKS